MADNMGEHLLNRIHFPADLHQLSEEQLSKLSVGSEIFLTNAKTGERVRYEVYQIKSIASDAFSALKSYHGDAGLTLMTCKDNGTNRLLVRCEQKEAAS